jgi:hypothetical protein
MSKSKTQKGDRLQLKKKEQIVLCIILNEQWGFGTEYPAISQDFSLNHLVIFVFGFNLSFGF